MRIVTRYLLREFIRPFLVCLFSFDAIFLVFDLFDNVSKFIGTGLPAIRILQYYGCLIASYSHWFAPASLMLATLYSMWTLSRNSEITAMRASGSSFTRLSMPFLVVSVLVAGLQALNAEYLVPEAASWAARMKDAKFDPERVASDPHANFQFVATTGRRQWFFNEIDLANDATASSVTGAVSVLQERPDGSPMWKVSARGARFLDGEWWFLKPRVNHFDFDDGELPSRDVELGMPNWVRMGKLAETPRDIVLFVRDWDNYSVRDMRRSLQTSGMVSRSHRFDILYRFAAPWACFVITLFAVPAGLTTARQSIASGIITALAAFFGFYAMTHFCTFLGERGTIPAVVAAWLPNVVFLVAGIVNFRRLS